MSPSSSPHNVSGNDIALLASVARHFLYDLDYEKAAKYYERLLDLHPSMWDNFVICGQYAICLKKIARAQEAAQIVATALDRCRLAVDNLERKRRQGAGGGTVHHRRALARIVVRIMTRALKNLLRRHPTIDFATSVRTNRRIGNDAVGRAILG